MLKEEIKKHLFIEFYYSMTSNDDNINLNETAGEINELDKYVKVYEKKLTEALRFIQTKELLDYSFNVTEKDFSNIKTFFDKILVTTNLTIEEIVKIQKASGYQSKYSGFDENGIYNVNIKINKLGPFNSLFWEAKKTFGHELTHAYDDFNRRINNAPSYEEHSEKSGYYYINSVLLNNEGDNKEAIANILYYLDTMERNAYIGQLKTELSQYKITGSKSGYEALRKTQVWENMTYLEQQISDLNDINGKEEYNKTQKELLSYYNELTNSNLNTYNQFVKVINIKYKKLKDKFITVVPKIIYLLRTEIGTTEIDNKKNTKLKIK